MFIVYTPHITPRFEYVIRFLLGAEALLTHDRSSYETFHGHAINYSANSIRSDEVHIVPEGLLHETGLRKEPPTVGTWDELPVLFPHEGGDMPFDLLAAIFYLLSRYEEYVDDRKDVHGRFNVQHSIAFQYDFLDRPLIDEWVRKCEAQNGWSIPHWLVQEGGLLQPQYDIDIAYRYRGHSPFRNIAGFFKDMLGGDVQAVQERALVYNGKRPDPYDVYDWLDALHEQYSLRPIYFFLVAEKRNRPDLNLDPHTRSMHELIASHAKKYTIALHPSAQSNEDKTLLLREKQLLSFQAQTPIHISRQHFLKMQLPDTYARLTEIGITEDHSMAYGSHNGFRASTTRSFQWYDLQQERTGSLRIHPFCYMDSTAIFHERLNAEMALERMEMLLQSVKAVHGVFRFVMHNHFLAMDAKGAIWRDVYTRFLERNA